MRINRYDDDMPSAAKGIDGQPPLIVAAWAFVDISARLDQLFVAHKKIEAEITQTREAYREAYARITTCLEAESEDRDV